MQRQRKLTGAAFAQAAVFGWLGHPEATRRELHQSLLQTGQQISAPGFEARFSPQAASFLRMLVEIAGQQVFESEVLSPLLERFAGVYLTDCTRVETPTLALKVGARLELQQGALQLGLASLQTHDNACAIGQMGLPAGALHVGDLGFFDLERFAHWQQVGVDWITRYKLGTTLYGEDGERLSLESLLNSAPQTFCRPVQVGHTQRLPMYLLAQRLDEATYQVRLQRLRQRARRKQQPLTARRVAAARWTLYLTSLPDLSFAQVHTLYRARWQIERLFKRWKSLAHLSTSTTRDPNRRACELYAKLLAVLVAHWLTQRYAWPDRHLSHDQCFRLIQHYAACFYLACFHFPDALPSLDALLLTLAAAAPLSSRRSRPNAVTLWQHFDALA